MEDDKRTVFQRIQGAMADIGAIAKDRKNEAQRFRYRGIDDVYNGVQGAMAKHGVFTTPYVVSRDTTERKSKQGGIIYYHTATIDYVVYGAGGDCLPWPIRIFAEAMDSGDKGFNKVLAIGEKYLLMQLFKIPTEEQKDPDRESHQTAAQGAPDAAQDKPEAKPEDKPRKYTKQQREEMVRLCDILGLKDLPNDKRLSARVQEITGTTIATLTEQDADKLISALEQDILNQEADNG